MKAKASHSSRPRKRTKKGSPRPSALGAVSGLLPRKATVQSFLGDLPADHFIHRRYTQEDLDCEIERVRRETEDRVLLTTVEIRRQDAASAVTALDFRDFDALIKQAELPEDPAELKAIISSVDGRARAKAGLAKLALEMQEARGAALRFFDRKEWREATQAAVRFGIALGRFVELKQKARVNTQAQLFLWLDDAWRAFCAAGPTDGKRFGALEAMEYSPDIDRVYGGKNGVRATLTSRVSEWRRARENEKLYQMVSANRPPALAAGPTLRKTW